MYVISENLISYQLIFYIQTNGNTHQHLAGAQSILVAVCCCQIMFLLANMLNLCWQTPTNIL